MNLSEGIKYQKKCRSDTFLLISKLHQHLLPVPYGFDTGADRFRRQLYRPKCDCFC